MIGAEAHEPFAPLLLTVNVPAGEIVDAELPFARFLDQLAGRDRDAFDRSLSACLMTGTTRFAGKPIACRRSPHC